MFSIRKNSIILFAAAAILANASAAEQTVEFDPAQTQVHFVLDTVLHTVHGEFKLKKGTIRFDPETGVAGGALVIDATSGQSGNGPRDSRMHKSILESAKYPEITFTPQHVKGQVAAQGDSQVEVEGTFNLHGKDHPLTLVAHVTANAGAMTATTQFEVPYIAWGLKNPSTLFLRCADKVQLEIHATGHTVAGK